MRAAKTHIDVNIISQRGAAAMEFVSAGHVSEAWWTEACKKVKNALVFVDGPTAESLHWSGGLNRLAEAGAKNIKEFSSFEVWNGQCIKQACTQKAADQELQSKSCQDAALKTCCP